MDRARRSLLLDIAAEFGTPVYVYDAAVLRQQLASLANFDRVRFAQKACANLHVLRLLRSAGALVDCVSPGELERGLWLPAFARAASPLRSSTPPTS